MKGTRMVRKFLSYYRPHWKLFCFDMFCAILVAAADLFYPEIARTIINVYVPNQNLRMLMIWSLVLLLIYLAKCLLNFCMQYWGHIVGVRLQADMREDLFRHIQKLPFGFFDEHKTGNLMSRLVNDLMDVSELAHHGPEDVFLSGLMLVGAFVMLGRINLTLTLIIFTMIPVIVFFAVKMRGRLMRAFTATREKIAAINAKVETSLAGIRISRAYTSEHHEIGRFHETNKEYQTARSSAYREMGYFHAGMSLMMDLLYLLVLTVGGIFFIKGIISPGDFTAYLLYITMLLNPIRRFVNIFEQIQNGMSGFKRFCEIMAVSPEPEDEKAVSLTEVHGDICFDKVSFRYGSRDEAGERQEVIHNLSLNIPAGRMIALVGPSGGGKTTLCHLIPRFYEVSEGSIRIDGIDIRRILRRSLRKQIGIVAQDVFIFDGTVRENIAYGDFDATDEQIVEAAKRARIHDYIMTLEHGYDTQVGERGIKLSGGQKQRLSIARVFLKNPPILILDEATSALDNITEQQIQYSLEELSAGRTTIVVAHRLSTVRNADEIIVLTSEGIVERGTHEELLRKGGVYATLHVELAPETAAEKQPE